MPPRYPPPKKGILPAAFAMPYLPRLVPVILCAPSGGGKTTLATRLVTQFPSYIAHSISHTTRSRRSTEVDGVDYQFVTDIEMRNIITSGQLLEYAVYAGRTYGTSKETVDSILNSGKICLLTIDITGCESIRKLYDAKYIFLMPPDKKALEDRIRARTEVTVEEIEQRLNRADEEIAYAQVPGHFDAVIVNDDIDQCYKKLVEFLSDLLKLAKEKEDEKRILCRLNEMRERRKFNLPFKNSSVSQSF